MDLAQALRIPIKRVNRAISKKIKELSFIAKADLSTAPLALFSTAWRQSLATQQAVREQVTLLLAAQNGQYKAFVSAETNRAISNAIQSDNTLITLLKAIKPEGNPNIYIQNHASSAIQQVTNVLTVEKAMELIAKQSTQMPINLPQSSAISLLPEVRANHQERLKSDGLKSLKHIKSSNPTIEDLQNSKDLHNDRRANELGIFEDENTPLEP